MVAGLAMYQKYSLKHQSFVYTQSDDQTVLFQTIQFSIGHLLAHSLNAKQFNLTHRYDPIMCYDSESESYWEQWQLKSTPYSSKLQDWSLAIKFFSVISRTRVGRVLPFTEMQSVYSKALADWAVKSLVREFPIGNKWYLMVFVLVV